MDDEKPDSPQTPTGTTALWKAITLTTLDMKALYQYIKTKGNLNVTNEDGYGLVYLAAQNNSMEALRLLLLTSDLKVNTIHGPHQELALHAAASAGSDDAVELLLEHGSKVNEQDSLGYTPLSNAIFAKAKTCVDLLVDTGASLDIVDLQGNTLLHLAVSKQFMEAIKLLIKKKPDLIDQQNHRGLSPLAIAIGFGYQDVVKLLIEEGGADVDGKTRVATVLHHAVTWNRMDALQALVDRGATINVVNAMEETPLLVAVQQRKIDMVRYLVAKGADPSYSVDGTSSSSINAPLLYAANHGYTELCAVLITKETSNYFIQMAADMSDRASFTLTAQYLRSRIDQRMKSTTTTSGLDLDLTSPQSSLSTPVTSTTAPVTTLEDSNDIPSRLFDADFNSLINTFSDDEDTPNNNNNSNSGQISSTASLE
ncbi:ankyrin repeat-containing domain protein [Chlamydoabsidia padenii]|nr:ankyrin repeat-containing domain protein [Chlamydoabsidia padenii]